MVIDGKEMNILNNELINNYLNGIDGFETNN